MPLQLPKRAEVSSESRWNLEALYADNSSWEADLQVGQQLPARVAAYQGRLGESAQTLADALALWFSAMRHMEKVWVYAHLRSDEDLSNSAHQSMMERARSALIRLDTAGSFLSPEILAIDSAVMAEWIQDPEVASYRFWLEQLLRSKPHVLSPDEERLLSMAAEPLGAIAKTVSVLKNVDLAARLPTVVDDQGQEAKLTHALFIKILEGSNRELRKTAFERYYAEFGGNRHTIATALDGGVKTHLFMSRARKFPSALEAALFDDNVSVTVYNALIEAVHGALPAFYRYMGVRKRLLGLDKLHLYDIYASAVPAVDLRFPYELAVDTITQALAPLGSEYVDAVREGALHGWVDRYENVGKRSGAYSSGCYDSMPYVLLNYTGSLEAMFTLAHELGHSMHSWYSDRAQPYHLAGYRILVAEVASTTNESLLTHHLLANHPDRATRAYLIDRYLNELRGTLFRQTMFAEFEKLIHEQAENGQPLTVDTLDKTYYELVKLYFGDQVAFDAEDEPITWEWSRVDHFFYNFYVYKYATGISSAVAIASSILQEGAPALHRYLTFLRGGGSRYPMDLLKGAGVDLTTPEPVSRTLQEFERLVAELDELTS
jgi:oligoendopeptidase F